MHGRLHLKQYANVTICEEWYTYSKFKAWLTAQPGWEDMVLDKDLLVRGNTQYGPDTCLLIPQVVNAFIADSHKAGKLPGAARSRYKKESWIPQFWDGNTNQHLGKFATEQEAHEAWKKAKHARALVLAETLTDERAKQALRARYL